MAFDALILRTKTALTSLSSLFGISNSRSWFQFSRETSPGAWQRNEEFDIGTILTNPTLNACITRIAADVSKLRPMLVEQDNHRIWNEVDSPAFSPVLRNPNSYQNPLEFFQWWMVSKLIHGNTYALKSRDARGVVISLYILNPCRVKTLLAPDGSIFYQLSEDPLADIEDQVIVPAREIIHDVMCPLFHPLCGMSPIYAAGFSADEGLNIRRTSHKFFANGSKPGGVLTAPGDISQAAADRIKAFVDTEFSGDKIGKTLVLGNGLHFESMAATAEQSQLIEQLRMVDEDIAKVFGMPRYKVGIGPEPNYNNIGALNQQYWTDCLQPHIVNLQLKLTKGLGLDNVPGRTLAVEFDLDDLQLMDVSARIDAGVKAIVGGMSPNEARFRFFDLGPVDGGETPYLQEQNWPLRLLNAREVPGRPPTEPADVPSSSDQNAKYFGDSLQVKAIAAGLYA